MGSYLSFWHRSTYEYDYVLMSQMFSHYKPNAKGSCVALRGVKRGDLKNQYG
jgi:hypothetical protein